MNDAEARDEGSPARDVPVVTPAQAPEVGTLPLESAVLEFLDRVEAELVLPYHLDRRGQLIVRETAQGRWRAVCAPLLVTELQRNPTGTESFLRVEMLGQDGRIEVLEIPNQDLSASRPKGVEMLRGAGHYMPGTGGDMAGLLRSFRPQRRGESGVPPGWHPVGKPMFGLRDGCVVVPPKLEDEARPKAVFVPDKARLECWKTEVAALTTRNPYALFALCHALSGPLLKPLQARSLGVNLALSTSSGKTTLAMMLAGVWPACPVEGWDNSEAGLEDLCAAASGSLLVLDEIPRDRVRKVVSDIYRIMNGRPRGVRRGGIGRSAADTRPADWSMPVVSTSEHPLPVLANDARVRMPGGAKVRMVDLSPETLWVDHTGFGSTFDLLKALEASLAATQGIAGPMFVHRYLQVRDRSEGILPTMQEKVRSVLQNAVPESQGLHRGVRMRLLDAFVTVALAGLIASKLEILPQTSAQVLRAVSLVLREVLDPEPPASAHAAALERLRSWLSRYAASRLAEIDDAGRLVGRSRAAHGWRTEDAYFLLPDTLRVAIGAAHPMAKFLHYIDERGLLRRSRDPSSFQIRMGARIHARPYVYCILRQPLDDLAVQDPPR